MFRRVATRAPLTSTIQTRTYFYAGAGEVGIWGKTLLNMCRNIAILAFVAPFVLYKVAFVDRANIGRQFVADASDLYESDGTEMEGEEAVANLRIYRERIMPFMEEFEGKIEAASS
jgi:hypothetical protein